MTTPAFETQNTHHFSRWGIQLRIMSGVLFIAMALCIKMTSTNIPLGQIVFFRSAFAMIPLVIFLFLMGDFPRGLYTKRPLGHLARSGLGAVAMFTSFASIARLPLAESTLIGYLSPIMMAVLAVLVLKEQLNSRRFIGIGLGMLGVLVLTLPQVNASELDVTRLTGYGLGLLTGLFTAAALIQVRRLSSTESTGAIAFYFVLVSMLASLLTIPGGWVLPGQSDLVLLILAGLLGGCAHIAMTLAFKYAEASLLAPFEYLTLVWAGMIDLLWFDTGLGVAFIIALPLVLAGAAVASSVRQS